MATLRAVPLRRAGNRPNLVLGGDREMVMIAGLMAFALVFNAMEVRATIYGMFIWFGALYVLRLAAKHDPWLRPVYMRHRRYRPYYPARSTPHRINTLSRK